MINIVAQCMSEKLESLPYATEIGGLVSVFPYPCKDGETVTYQNVPISCNMDYNECIQQGALSTLVPSSKAKSIFFMESRGAIKCTENNDLPKGQSTTTWTGIIRLIGIVNQQRVKLMKDGEIVDTCVISPYIISEIKKLVEGICSDTNDCVSGQIKIKCPSQAEKNRSIFSRYDSKLFECVLFYPFDYFALDFPFELKETKSICSVSDDPDVGCRIYCEEADGCL